MKRNLLFTAAFTLILISFIIYKKTGGIDDAKMLSYDVKADQKLLPRMTKEQMNAVKFFIPSVTEGMLVYKTCHNPGIYYFKDRKWVRIKTLWHR